MAEKPERFTQLEEKVWKNLDSSGLASDIISKSCHAAEPIAYGGVDLYTRFSYHRPSQKSGILVQIYILNMIQSATLNNVKFWGGQPVTPKIYRLSQNEDEQREICSRIWDGISDDDLLYLAEIGTESYLSRGRYTAPGEAPLIRKLSSAINGKRNVDVTLLPNYARYMISLPDVKKKPALPMLDGENIPPLGIALKRVLGVFDPE